MAFYEDRRVLLTGGAGLIGSYLAELLVADGAKVTVADDLSRGRIENLRSVSSEIRFLQVDLRDAENAGKACEGQEIVMNLAAPVAGIEYGSTHHGRMLSDSLLLSTNVLDACVEHGVARYLYCSSSCVYPDDALVPTPESEGGQNRPETANEGYGWGKLMGEQQARYYAKEHGIQTAIARPFNTYGPREYPEDIERAHVLPGILSRVLRGDDPLVVWGSGQQTRSFVHAGDMAMGIKLVCERYAAADPVNVGHDEETRIKDLVELIQDVTGSRRPVVFDTTRPEGPLRKAADISKFRTLIGEMPRTPLRDGLVEMSQFFRTELARGGEQITADAVGV